MLRYKFFQAFDELMQVGGMVMLNNLNLDVLLQVLCLLHNSFICFPDVSCTFEVMSHESHVEKSWSVSVSEACENRFKFVSAQHQYVSKKDENDKVPGLHERPGCELLNARQHFPYIYNIRPFFRFRFPVWVRFGESMGCQYVYYEIMYI